MTSIVALGFLLLSTDTSTAYELQQGVLIDQHNGSYVFAFPSPNRHLGSSARPAGEIRIGGNIVIKYSLKIGNSGKSRFVEVDASKLSGKLQRRAVPRLSVGDIGNPPGFYIKDSRQPQLDIHITTPFLFALRSALAKQSLADVRETLAREGNLSVLIGRTADGYRVYFRITKVIVE